MKSVAKDLIYCVKDGQPCSSSIKLLKEQLNLFMNPGILNSYSIEPTVSNIERANPEENLSD